MPAECGLALGRQGRQENDSGLRSPPVWPGQVVVLPPRGSRAPAASPGRSHQALPGAVPPAADEKGLGIVTTATSADHPTRRDFLFVATGAAAVVGGAAALWPLIAQMNPDASTIAAGAPIEVDLTPIAEGQDTNG